MIKKSNKIILLFNPRISTWMCSGPTEEMLISICHQPDIRIYMLCFVRTTFYKNIKPQVWCENHPKVFLMKTYTEEGSWTQFRVFESWM